MKNNGQEITEFGSLLTQTMSKQVQVQTHWATVTEVDWETKTMTVKGTADNLEFYDVLLGLGSHFRQPKVGATCLIGVIMNQKAATFLIDCAEIEGFETTDLNGFKLQLNNGILTIDDNDGYVIELAEGVLKLNGDNFEGVVKAPELKTQIDKNTAILQAIQNAITAWTPVPNDGGAAFKAGLASVPSMQRANLDSIKNDKIKHGG